MPTSNITQLVLNNNILSGSQLNLVSYTEQPKYFNESSSHIECYIYSSPDNILLSYDSSYNNYQFPGSLQQNIGTSSINVNQLIFNPDQDINLYGFTNGNFNIIYNILTPIIDTSLTNTDSFYISAISPDRTELKLVSNYLNSSSLEYNYISYTQNLSTSSYNEFYINFQKNNILAAVNINLDKSVTPYNILIKLLNPLPQNYNIHDTLNIDLKVSNTFGYAVQLIPDPIIPTYQSIKSPNFDIDLDYMKTNPSQYYNFNNLSSITASLNPYIQRVIGSYSSSIIVPNIDYTNYSNFVHFSSINYRIQNFYYKLQQLEQLNNLVSASTTINLNNYNNQINSIYQSFDNYENFLYFESSSIYTYPKQNNTPPYIPYSTTSSVAYGWLSSSISSASLYDQNNKDYIIYLLPRYIIDNTDNDPMFRFMGAIGQVYDEIWLYSKGLTDLYKADNGLYNGISKDLVYYALNSIGIKNYTNNDQDNLLSYLYGVNGSLNSSSSNIISASNYPISGQDVQKSIYKRIYHNIPLLLKSKGTLKNINYFNTIFGIPSTILYPIEYGGTDKTENTYEYSYDRFAYAIYNSGSSSINIPWITIPEQISTYNYTAPDAIEFRFRPDYTTSSISQSLMSIINYSGSNQMVNLSLQYTGSYNNYKGDYGNITLSILGFLGYVTASLTLPIFNTDSDNQCNWWNVLLQRRIKNNYIGDIINPQYYDLYVKTSKYGYITQQASCSIYIAGTTSSIDGLINSPLDYTYNSAWSNYYTTLLNDGSTLNNISIFDTGSAFVNLGGVPDNGLLVSSSGFTGQFQEFREWINPLEESTFDKHVLNPGSYEGNNETSSFYDLISRFTLGGNLYTYNHYLTQSVYSTHPNQRGSYISTASFINFPNKNNYIPFVETYYTDVQTTGYHNPNTNYKVRIVSSSIYNQEGNILLSNDSIQFQPFIPLTKDLHLIENSFSPQNEIDKDIIAELGSNYDIDDIIGDPSLNNYQSYPTLQALQYYYFQKYFRKYNYYDYISLIETYNNCLYKYIKDFIPARTNASTGLTIKQHLLERIKLERYEPDVNFYGLESNEIPIGNITSIQPYNNFKLYPISVNTNRGVVYISSSNEESIKGNFSGSYLDLSIYPTQDPFYETPEGYSCTQYNPGNGGVIISASMFNTNNGDIIFGEPIIIDSNVNWSYIFDNNNPTSTTTIPTIYAFNYNGDSIFTYSFITASAPNPGQEINTISVNNIILSGSFNYKYNIQLNGYNIPLITKGNVSMSFNYSSSNETIIGIQSYNRYTISGSNFRHSYTGIETSIQPTYQIIENTMESSLPFLNFSTLTSDPNISGLYNYKITTQNPAFTQQCLNGVIYSILSNFNPSKNNIYSIQTSSIFGNISNNDYNTFWRLGYFGYIVFNSQLYSYFNSILNTYNFSINNDIQQPFRYQDQNCLLNYNQNYNPLVNNILQGQLSKIRKQIQYNSLEFVSGLNSINVLPVELQDFNYYYKRHANPRYFGSENTTPNITYYNNISPIPVATFTSSYINSVFFNQPNSDYSVQKYCNYFAYFDSIITSFENYYNPNIYIPITAPGPGDKLNNITIKFHLSKIINSSGSVINLSSLNKNIDILNTMFYSSITYNQLICGGLNIQNNVNIIFKNIDQVLNLIQSGSIIQNGINQQLLYDNVAGIFRINNVVNETSLVIVPSNYNQLYYYNNNPDTDFNLLWNTTSSTLPPISPSITNNLLYTSKFSSSAGFIIPQNVDPYIQENFQSIVNNLNL